MRIRSGSSRGFTLVEVVVAMALLIIGVAGVLSLFPVGLKASKRASDLSMAAMLAEMKMAEVHYLGYDSLTSIEGIAAVPGNSGAERTFGEFPDYKWHLLLTSTSVTNLVKAALQIYWLDEGEQKTERFITYIADYN